MLENSRGRKSTEIPTTTTTTMTTANPLSFRKWFQTDECMKINSHQKQHSVSSSSLERNWNKNLQIYYIINNLSTLCVLILLSKCVYSLYPSITAIILFISSYTFATVFSISSIYFTSASSSSISLTTKYQLVEYIKNTPLSYLTFYYFTRLNCLKSTNSFDYNLLMLATVYFSVQTVVNCVLIEIRPSSLLRLRCIQILFLFIFRYFAFLAKLISVVLLYATLTDSTFIAVLRSSVDLDSLELALTKHIHSLTFLFLATCLVSFAVWHIFKSTRRRLSTNLNNCIGEAVFESYKLMIEYNETLVHGWTTRVFYMCVQFFMHIVAAYFWYYRAVIVLAKARAKTTLIGLLTRQNHLRVLMDLYELEEKLKTRQFEVVCVLGSLLISFLSSHIYYSYYKIDDHDEDEEESKSKETLRRRMTGRYVNSAQGRPSVFQIESARGGEDTVSSKDGSFMIHAENSQMSGSVSSWIASSVSSSSSSGIFNPNSYYNNNHHHKQMDCSTCCTSIDR